MLHQPNQLRLHRTHLFADRLDPAVDQIELLVLNRGQIGDRYRFDGRAVSAIDQKWALIEDQSERFW